MNKVVEQVLWTIAVDIDNTWVEKFGYAEFTINSLVNVSTSKAPFELVYETNIRTVVGQLDGVYHLENLSS